MIDLKAQLDEAIAKREFERAAGIRDQIKELEESTYKKNQDPEAGPDYEDDNE
jgi:protein-arginine kinase activator protein McsA